MKRLLVVLLFSVSFAASSSGGTPHASRTDQKPIFPGGGRVLLTIAADGSVHVESGVTAQELAEAWVKSYAAQEARASRCEAFVRDLVLPRRK